MDGKVKIRGMSSVPNTLGRQIGILPVGNPSVRPRRSKPRSLKIPKGQSESVYRRRTNNTMAKRKSKTDKQRSTKHTHKTKD
jgi:hypothetical protein